jgi:hypothetical protein
MLWPRTTTEVPGLAWNDDDPHAAVKPTSSNAADHLIFATLSQHPW